MSKVYAPSVDLDIRTILVCHRELVFFFLLLDRIDGSLNAFPVRGDWKSY